MLFLDCCYGAAFEKGVVARGPDNVDVAQQFSPLDLPGGKGLAVLTASTATEFSFEGSKVNDDGQAPSFFTSALVEGIHSGDADRDEDGQVSFEELYRFVLDQVGRQAPNQTPTKFEFGMQGDVLRGSQSTPPDRSRFYQG